MIFKAETVKLGSFGDGSYNVTNQLYDWLNEDK